MKKSLIILESPVKIKTFQKYLNANEYHIMATRGHIMELSDTNLSINLETFEPIYEVQPDKEDIVKNIGLIIKKVKNVYLGLDNDREGEMIAFNNATYFKLKNPKRILFNSITQNEILNALQNPTTINMNMVKSQQTRRMIDRFYGFLISNKLPQGCKSCGRVQSNIVKIVIDKEDEIQKYYESNQSTFFTIYSTVIFENLKCNTTLKYGDITKFNNPETEKILKISTSILSLNEMKDEIIEQYPHDPFMTTTLQQQANTSLNLSAKETDTIAQKLYENGYITYIRTDSIIISNEAQSSIKNYVIQNYTDKYYNETVYKNKNEHVQGAHECIRPTNIDLITITGTENEIKLYNLIWKRTIQSQMKPALKQKISVKINISNLENHTLEGKIETLIFNGFLILDGVENEKSIVIDEINNIDWLDIESNENIKNQPSRYDEASLIKYLTKLNIVRPSTCSDSISRPIERGYLLRSNISGISKTLNKYILTKNKNIKHLTSEIKIGSEKNRYVSTDLGRIMCKFLKDNFDMLLDKNYTIHMENQLDEVAAGNLEKIEIIKPIYDYINGIVSKMSFSNPNALIIGNINNEPLELVKSTKFGNFVKYKEDKINIKDLYEDEMSPSKETIMEYVQNKITRDIGMINGEPAKIKYGLYGYFCLYKNEKINVNDYMKDNLNASNEEIIEYLKEFKIPILVGKINNLNVELKNGKNGHYLNYNDYNHNVEFMFETTTPTNDELIEYLKKKLDKSSLKKEWIIKKNKYVFKKGMYGYFLEEYKNDVKIRNININEFINQKLLSDSIESVLEKITKKELTEFL